MGQAAAVRGGGAGGLGRGVSRRRPGGGSAPGGTNRSGSTRPGHALTGRGGAGRVKERRLFSADRLGASCTPGMSSGLGVQLPRAT